MQNASKEKRYHKSLFPFEEFLLAHESAQQAFMNLSKTKDVVSKDELLDETKRLLQELIMKQIKAHQVNLKKHRDIKESEKKIKKVNLSSRKLPCQDKE